jgi:hypothetical protein
METDLAKLQKFMPKSNKEKTILLLESLKDSKPFLYKGNSIAFASKTIEVVKKAVGDKSHQYFALEALMYDNTLHKLKGQIIPVDSLIVGMISNNKVNFDGLIDSSA